MSACKHQFISREKKKEGETQINDATIKERNVRCLRTTSPSPSQSLLLTGFPLYIECAWIAL